MNAAIAIATRTHSLILTKSFGAKAAIFGSDEYKCSRKPAAITLAAR